METIRSVRIIAIIFRGKKEKKIVLGEKNREKPITPVNFIFFFFGGGE